jgi:hypothetical protein
VFDITGQPNSGAACTDVLSQIGTPECSLFALADFSAPLSFSGEFATLGDMALFSFTFDVETRLQIETTSFGFGRLPAFQSFDPTLALYRSDGSIMRVPDPAGSGELILANQFDINVDSGNLDDRIDVVLADGSYLLALVAGFAYESLLTEFDCGSCDLTRGTGFALDFRAAAPAPIPEPGTLTLMAGGALAGLIQRRRAKRRARASSISR